MMMSVNNGTFFQKTMLNMAQIKQTWLYSQTQASGNASTDGKAV